MPGYKGIYSDINRSLAAEEARLKAARAKLWEANLTGFEPSRDLAALLTAYTLAENTVQAIDLLSKLSAR